MKYVVSISLDNVVHYYIIVLTVPPNFNSGSGTVSATPPVLNMRCGQDYEGVSLLGFSIVQITCPQYNGTDTTVTAYKDGVEIDGVEIDGFTGTLRFGPFPPPTDDIFGTYLFAVENDCGRDVAISRILCDGQYLQDTLCVLKGYGTHFVCKY